MKKFIALIMAVVMVLSFAGCNQQAENKTSEYTRPDLTWWQENYKDAQGEICVGHSGNHGVVTGGQLMAFIESVEYGVQASVRPLDSNFDTSHSVSFVNFEEKKNLNVVFYNDFEYVAIYENGLDLDSTPLYRLANKEQCIQFFADNGLYMPPAVRTHIEDKLYNIIKSGDVQQINDKVEPSGKDGSIVNIIPGQLKRLEISNIAPMSYAYGDYCASAEIAYDYGQSQRIYYATIFVDKNYDIASVYVTENHFEGEIISRYTVGDVDYSLWMEKADSSYHDLFRFWLGAGGGAYCDSAMEWRTAVLRAIRDLSLGELVDIKPKDWPRNQQYRIVLEQGNGYYDESPLVLEFYDDCNYVIICNCQRGGENPVGVCENHTQGYKVNNPEMVRQLFSIKGQYVSPEDYASMEKAVQTYMEKTSGEKLNKISNSDRKIVDGYQFKGDIANFKAECYDYTHLDNGREDYEVDFTAMFTKTKDDGKESYISYHFRMTVYRKGDSWKIDSLYMY